jgi:hypothetical protein
METTNHLVTTSTAASNSSCHRADGPPGGWLNQRQALIVGGVAIAAAIVIALGQQWLTIAALAPLLFLLPCAVMMFMCMRGHAHQTKEAPAPIPGKPSDPGSTLG